MPLHETRWMFKDAALKTMTERPQDGTVNQAGHGT